MGGLLRGGKWANGILAPCKIIGGGAAPCPPPLPTPMIVAIKLQVHLLLVLRAPVKHVQEYFPKIFYEQTPVKIMVNELAADDIFHYKNC